MNMNMDNKQLNYDYIIMIVVIPVLTTFVTKIFDKFFLPLLNILFLLFTYIFKKIYSTIFKNYGGSTIIIPLTKVSTGDYWSSHINITVDESALPLLWYIEAKMEKIKCAKLINMQITNHTEMAISDFNRKKDDDIDDKKYINKRNISFFLPIPTIQGDDLNELANDISGTIKKSPTDDTEKKNTDSDRKIIQKYKNNNSEEIEIDKDILIKFIPSGVAEQYKNAVELTSIIIKSNRKNMIELQKYLTNIEKDYMKYKKSQQTYKGKLFIYEGLKDNVPTYGVYDIDKSQTFDNLFFEHKDKLLERIKRLSDIDFYKKRGIKRKLSGLFIGKGGTGKTGTVNAIANYTDRVIIWVPISRIQYNSEIEKILYNNTYNQYYIPNDEKIIFFDEIDSRFDNNSMKKQIESNNNESQEKEITLNLIQQDKGEPSKIISENKSNDKSNDKFNVGIFLSLLDGINDQDGMMMYATANNIDAIDPNLYREGRLTLYEFTNMSRREISNMIEKYYNTILIDKLKESIRNDKKIQNLRLKYMCIASLEDGLSVEELIDKINSAENLEISNIGNTNNEK